MSEKFRLDRKICFQNRFNSKCINVIIDSIGPSIILRSIVCSHQIRIHNVSIQILYHSYCIHSTNIEAIHYA